MAWAIFDRAFRFDRRPAKAICFEVEPSPTPQSFPHDVIDAAVAAGAARRVKQNKRAFSPDDQPERKSR